MVVAHGLISNLQGSALNKTGTISIKFDGSGGFYQIRLGGWWRVLPFAYMACLKIIRERYSGPKKTGKM
jgi:hypothetical protein